jgi:hypothetical protein
VAVLLFVLHQVFVSGGSSRQANITFGITGVVLVLATLHILNRTAKESPKFSKGGLFAARIIVLLLAGAVIHRFYVYATAERTSNSVRTSCCNFHPVNSNPTLTLLQHVSFGFDLCCNCMRTVSIAHAQCWMCWSGHV